MSDTLEKYGSMRPLRSRNKMNKNIQSSFSEQKIQNFDRNAPVLNPQKKYPQQIYEKPQNHFIKLQEVKFLNLIPKILDLYNSVNYEKASLYGFNIRSLQNQLKNSQRTSLMILWGLYQTLNWESLSLTDLESYIKNIPQTEEQVEEILIENSKIKINKLSMSLQIGILNHKVELVTKKHEFNRSICSNYEKSITKLTHELKSYQFKGPILQVQSNNLMIAVRTSAQISIINPEGKIKSFNIQSKGITVRQNRCYFVKMNNKIGSIFIQTTYIPKLNQVALEDKYFADELKDSEFFVSNENVTLIVDVNVKEQSILVRKMQGNIQTFDIDIEPQGQQNLVDKKAYLSQNHLFILLFLGIGKTITKVFSYKFFVNQ